MENPGQSAEDSEDRSWEVRHAQPGTRGAENGNVEPTRAGLQKDWSLNENSFDFIGM